MCDFFDPAAKNGSDIESGSIKLTIFAYATAPRPRQPAALKPDGGAGHTKPVWKYVLTTGEDMQITTDNKHY